jgi:hypothetical protein
MLEKQLMHTGGRERHNIARVLGTGVAVPDDGDARKELRDLSCEAGGGPTGAIARVEDDNANARLIGAQRREHIDHGGYEQDLGGDRDRIPESRAVACVGDEGNADDALPFV